MELEPLLNSFATLFVTIDPIGVLPMFIALTAGMNPGQRRATALRASVLALIILCLFALAGGVILRTLGITIHAFRIAGGLLLFYIAFEMIFERRQERHEKTSKKIISSEEIANIATFPLAIPLIAGPGSISAVILIAGEHHGDIADTAFVFVVIAAVLLSLFLTFIAADFIEKMLGNTGRMILTRLMGVLLAALSVQYVVDGMLALVR